MANSRPDPVITLTTDFGLTDHYVGSMKGVLLSRCPNARLVDISHEIAPFSIYSGAYTIDQAAPFFPVGTVHVVVIDPGVGTTRKPMLLEALGQYFVAPDNGVLSMIAARDGAAEAREITNRALWLPSPSSTFHGRDIFAPTAAAIASGAATPEDVGPVLEHMETLADLEPVQTAQRRWQGRVLSVDHFGNVITNFSAVRYSAMVMNVFKLLLGSYEVTRFEKTFGSAPAAACFVYVGSSGYLEAGINQQSAAAAANISPGDTITLLADRSLSSAPVFRDQEFPAR